MSTPRPIVHHGDCFAVLRTLPDESVDAVVTDPPYGLSNTDPKHVAETLTKWVTGDHAYTPPAKGGFMGKTWDSFVPPPAVWDECMRVLKPGGHLLVFAGSRTQDLMGLSVRLAGFEIRDGIGWVHSQGFPKSMDVSKAIDKVNGHWRGRAGAPITDNPSMSRPNYERTPKGDPVTPEAERWSGWGTALKPSHEPLVVARKPHGISGILSEIGSELSRLEDECRPSANGVARSSVPTPVDSPEETTDTAPASAATPHAAGPGQATGTGAAVGSSAQTDTSWSDGATPTAWSTVSSWRTCWVELCELTSTSITSTMTEATTDLRTLWSSIESLTVTNMPDSPTPALTSGSTASAVDNLFAATVLRLRATHALSVTESATESTPTSRQAAGDGSPAIEPVIVARKPIKGTVAGNVLAHGTGGINVDGCRVGTSGGGTHCGNRDGSGKCLGHGDAGKSQSGATFRADETEVPVGRFPPNVLLDPEAAAAMDQQSGVLSPGNRPRVRNADTNRTTYGSFKGQDGLEQKGMGSGGASRFFPVFKYQAKAPKKERPQYTAEDGRVVKHATVKPLELMRWLVRLVTPPGGVVLDPFAGSGTTGEAAMLEGFDSILIEGEAEYLPLIDVRIERSNDETAAPAPDSEPEPTSPTLFDRIRATGSRAELVDLYCEVIAPDPAVWTDEHTAACVAHLATIEGKNR